ncbi:nucleoporin NUP2 LALA0_S15e00166g [Lachancea lanzarotensis]|uniref:LALA0S15e00166g1_1 n=1 Tax=Lachancea lanzarotensis TaxID=1245769 RepID=A0A0C7NF01_9SACH|nr:uncharacterized protein LALA0_S15e00166g [Lachancea lanzarotensis]CEP64911.1 LALA0S15e00166g1_1 [Lachancea lanzarotensis]
MAKRIADNQMTREALEAAGSDENETSHPSQEGFKQASSDVLSKRRIAQPRKRKHLGFENGNGNSNSNGFGNQAGPATNAFSFGQTSSNAFSNAFSGGNASKSVSNADSITDSEIPAKRNALNLQFQTKISEYISNDPCADLSTVFEQYKRYLKEITTTPTASTSIPESKSVAPASVPASASASAPASNKKTTIQDSDSESDSDADIKVEGPTFTLSEKPTVKNSVFSFGPKKASKVDTSDSESEVEIKGPSFSFKPSSTSTTAKPVFKFSSEQSKQDTSDIQADQSSNSGEAEDASATSEQPPKFSFGASASWKPATHAADTTSVSDATTSDQPSKLSLGFAQPSKTLNTSSETQENKTPAFSFGTSIATKSDTNGVKPQHGSLFSQPVASTSSEKVTEKPAFKFGPSNSSVGSGAAVKTPSFTFGTSIASGENTGKSSGEKTEKPFSGFGLSSSSKDSANLESKGATVSNTTPASFKFSSAPKSDQVTQPKPAPSFVFGKKSESQQAESDKPKSSFAFGTNNASTAPSFTFGKPSDTKETPSSGFKFSLPFSSTAVATEPQNNSTESHPENTTTAETQPEEETKAMTMTNGEEGEELLFSKRAKLLLVNPDTKGYDSKGTGELKVLQDKDDKTKVRILCRSDGMGHVLLNTSVVKAFQYVPADAGRENFVKCPVVNGEGKLENYVLQVKQKADGRHLCKAIKDAQDGM